MEINQESFTQVAFAENLHRHIKRFLKSIRTEYRLTQQLGSSYTRKRGC